MPVLCQEYMLFFCLPLSSQPRLRLLRPLSISQHIPAYKKNKRGAGGLRPPPLPCSSCMLRYAEICCVAWAAWALADYSMANRKIAYTLGRGRACIFDISPTSGYMGAKYFQEFGPRFFDMSSASGYMGAKYFQECGPRCLGAYALVHTPLREVSKERGSCTWPHE